MSSELSTSSEHPAPRAAQREMFVPFQAWVRIVPNLDTGKRTALIRNLQKAARRAEQSIQDAVDNDLLSMKLNISTPILFTPQFGDFAARLTIVGFVERNRITDNRLNVSPTTDTNVIHSGVDQGEKTEIMDINRGGSLYESQDPVAVIDAEVSELRTALATALDPLTGIPGLAGFVFEDIVHIEYSGVKYGVKKQGGRSFP